LFTGLVQVGSYSLLNGNLIKVGMFIRRTSTEVYGTHLYHKYYYI
jgi:hypothetical protein